MRRFFSLMVTLALVSLGAQPALAESGDSADQELPPGSVPRNGAADTSSVRSTSFETNLPVVVALSTDAPPVTSSADIDGAVVAGADRGGDSGWFVTSVGQVVPYGDAPHLGDMDHSRLNQPIVAMAPTPSGLGYWLVAADGGVFSFGDAGFHGSTGGMRLAQPVIDVASTPSGLGYWLVASDGGVFSFGDARFHGSMGAVALNQPIVGMSLSDTGGGYWLVAQDGGVFTFGDAVFHGSTGSAPGSEAIMDIVVPLVGGGYWLVSEAGEVTAFGLAPDIATTFSVADGPVVAASAHGGGLWLTRNPARPTMAVWQSGGMRSNVLAAVIQSVEAAGGVSGVNHTGTVPVLAIHRGALQVSGATPGWQVPFTARAIDPEVSAVFVGGAVVGALDRSEVVLSRTTADLRGARPGDVITFVGWDGRAHTRRIGAVVPDRRVASSEIVFSISDAATFGFDRPSSVWVAGVDNLGLLESQLTAVAATNAYVRWARSWDAPNPDSVLSSVRLKQVLGEFEYRYGPGDSIEIEPAWVAANIALQEVPVIGRLRCHVAVFADLTAALSQVEAAGLAHLIDANDTLRIGGCWVSRRIRGASGGAVSRHAWGLAIDVNPSTNRWGTTPTLDQRIVDIFRANGFAWGGTWTRPDGMHFEWIGAG
jgi:hypothetical protein